MLKFKNLNKNSFALKKYYEQSKTEFCDISVGVKFLWRDNFKVKYAVYRDTLILKETNKDYKNAFYYPMGSDEYGALEKIYEETLYRGKDLTLCYLSEECAKEFKQKFPNAEIYFDRDWSDYLYDAKEFSELIGKKYSGQRNHINKFNKLYPNFEFRRIEKTDIGDIKTFLKAYGKGKPLSSWTERAEGKRLIEYLSCLEELGNIGVIIKIDGKVVALSCGERLKNTFIVHVEKALTEYSGIYPTLANLFIKMVTKEGITEINREEDCGDLGLRTSKMQYHPKEIRNKYIVKIKAKQTGDEK